ncbi:hypothetical protein Mal52_23840 [Symmachiella dynata]|uniref:Uncharacterized protein n=2 Tax=Symmachiella dynata TaxID=2527995 RepID=A0A517ZN64_9PLAN|nr:hypothetical protein Mal52_23840 [Symmachiella dynata]
MQSRRFMADKVVVAHLTEELLMRSRHILSRGIFAAALWTVCIPSLSAAEAAERRPFVGVMTISSLNDVQDDLHYVFESAGIPEKARTIQAMANLMTAGFGSAGIDSTKPLGWAIVDRQADYAPFGFVPIEDEEQFLKLVRVYVPYVKVTHAGQKEPPPNDEFVVHFQDGYAFIYYGKKAAVRFASPKDFIPEDAKLFDFSVSVQVDQIDDEHFVETFEAIYADLQARIPDLPKLSDDELPEQIVAQAGNLFVGFRISQEDRGTVLEMRLAPKAEKSFEQFQPVEISNIEFSTNAYWGALLNLLDDVPELRELAGNMAPVEQKILFQLQPTAKQIRLRVKIGKAYPRIVAHAYSSTFSDMMPFGMPPKTLILLGYLIGGPPSIEPAFDEATGLSLKQSSRKLLLVCQAKDTVKTDDNTLAATLQQSVRDQLKSRDITTSKISKSKTPDLQTTSAKDLATLGKSEEAGFVISLLIKKFTLVEDGSSDLYRCRATVDVSVIRVGNGESIFEREVNIHFPLRGPVSNKKLPLKRFRELSIKDLSQQIGYIFYERYAGDYDAPTELE